MMFYVYLHCKPDGIPFYVGKGSGWRSHNFKSGRNPYHKSIVAKYGRENIKVSIIPCPSEAEAFYLEIQLIRSFRILGFNLVNMTDGGEGMTGFTISAETIAKRVAKVMGKKRGPQSLEWITKRADAVRGRKCSDETRKRISDANKGQVPWSTGLKRGPMSEEQKAKISASLKVKGIVPPLRKGIGKCL